MSKVTLDFQLNCLTVDIGDSKRYRDTAEEEWYATHLMMQYAEMGAQTIEGGGRMIVALENGTFTIPKDAQKGLIYIGLDENLEPVTGLFTSEGEN